MMVEAAAQREIKTVSAQNPTLSFQRKLAGMQNFSAVYQPASSNIEDAAKR
jgi:hypothetical protein